MRRLPLAAVTEAHLGEILSLKGTVRSMDLFALNASREFGAKVAAELGLELAPHEEREFEDGEHKARPLVSVRNHDVYLIQSLYSGPVESVNDKLS